MSDEIDLEVVEQIKASAKLRGPIEKVVLSADGKLVDGHQRKAADPDWPEEVNPKLVTEKDCVLFDIDKNWNRTTKSENWKRSRILKLCRLGLSVQEIHSETGLPERTIYRYMPVEFKNPVKAEAGRVGGPEASVARVATQILELEAAEEKARAVLTDCFNCKMATRQDQLRIIDGKSYCPRCAPFVKHVKPKEAPEKPVSPSELDSPEMKKARMQPYDSQFQQEVFVELANEGLVFEQNRELPVFTTTPDGLREDVHLLVYLDNSDVHKGKRLDKDEQLREQYKKHHVEVTVLGIPFKGKSDKEKARVKALIREKYEFLKEELQKWATGKESVTLPGASDDKEEDE